VAESLIAVGFGILGLTSLIYSLLFLVLIAGNFPALWQNVVTAARDYRDLCRAEVRARVPGLSTVSNPPESIELLTVWWISADFGVNALREHQESYNVRSDGGDRPDVGGAIRRRYVADDRQRADRSQPGRGRTPARPPRDSPAPGRRR